MITQLKRHLPPLLLILLTVLILTPLLLPSHAFAGEQLQVNDDKNLYYDYEGETFVIGVLYHDESGKNYYCMEVEKPDNGENGPFTPRQDGNSRQLAWLMQHYQNQKNPLAHAAIGVMVHDEYDPNQELWAKHRLAALDSHADLGSEIQRLKDEAEKNAPIDSFVQGEMIEGEKGGSVKVQIHNSAGESIAGVKYVLTLKGPAEFSSGGTEVEGKSEKDGTVHTWTVTGKGEVSVQVSYAHESLGQVDSQQDFIRTSTEEWSDGALVNLLTPKEEPPVTPPVTPPTQEEEEPVSIVTQVDPEKVSVDEKFRDTAVITGKVPEGSVVVFKAYKAVEEGEQPDSRGFLLEDGRIELEAGTERQTVHSPFISSPEPGLVHWQATVLSSEGKVLATHELGIDGETVLVETPPDPKDPPEEEQPPENPEEPKQPENPKTPEQPQTPKAEEQPKLSQTGVDFAAIFVAAVSALAVGVFMLALIRRRSL